MSSVLYHTAAADSAETIAATLAAARAGIGADYMGLALQITAGIGAAAVLHAAREWNDSFNGSPDGRIAVIEIISADTPDIVTQATELAGDVGADTIVEV